MKVIAVSTGRWYFNSRGKKRYVHEMYKNVDGVWRVTYSPESLINTVRTCSQTSFIRWCNK